MSNNKIKNANIIDNKKKEVLLHESITITSGPLPSPEKIREYDLICPGAADRIIREAEKQTDHRINIEKKVIYNDVLNSKLGLIFGFIIVMTVLVGGFYLIVNDKEVSGVVTLIIAVSSLIGIWLREGKKSEKELESKR